MLRIVPHTVPRVGRSYEHFPDGFELHLLPEPKEPQGYTRGSRAPQAESGPCQGSCRSRPPMWGLGLKVED